MKYAATKDMNKFKSEALEQADRWFAARRASLLGPNADIHRAKFLEASSREGAGSIIRTEAKFKGMSTEELAQEVWVRGIESQAQLGALERERQEMQVKIRSAECPADLSKIMKGVL